MDNFVLFSGVRFGACYITRVALAAVTQLTVHCCGSLCECVCVSRRLWGVCSGCSAGKCRAALLTYCAKRLLRANAVSPSRDAGTCRARPLQCTLHPCCTRAAPGFLPSASRCDCRAAATPPRRVPAVHEELHMCLCPSLPRAAPPASRCATAGASAGVQRGVTPGRSAGRQRARSVCVRHDGRAPDTRACAGVGGHARPGASSAISRGSRRPRAW